MAEVEAIHGARKRAHLDVQEAGDDEEWEDIDNEIEEVHAQVRLLTQPEGHVHMRTYLGLSRQGPFSSSPTGGSFCTQSSSGIYSIRSPSPYPQEIRGHGATESRCCSLPICTHHSSSPPPKPSPTILSPSYEEGEEEEFESTPDALGVFRRYFREPQALPEDDGALEDVCDAPDLEGSNATSSAGYKSVYWLSRSVAVRVDDPEMPDYGPFENAYQFRLYDYFYDQSSFRSPVPHRV